MSRLWRASNAASAVFLAVSACASPPELAHDGPSKLASPSASAAQPLVPNAASSSAPRAHLPPLTGVPWLSALPMPPGRNAVVAVPLGATTPRPVVVAVHGAGDRPEWACGGWRIATNEHAFVVCPGGLPTGGVFVTAPSARLEADIDAALASLRARHGDHVASGKVIYAGFSLGAIRAPAVLASSSHFSAAVLLEGGYELWSAGAANAFREHGGERALLMCAGRSCGQFAAAAGHLRRAGIEVSVGSAGTGRHNLDAEMMQRLRAAWPFVVAGDARWAGWDGAR